VASAAVEVNLIEQQAGERRAHILEVTRQCIVERGYEGLTVRELARACRVSVPTLYRQFGGKQELVREAIQSHFESAVLGEMRADPVLRGHARLLKIIDLSGEDIRRMPAYYRQLLGVFVGEKQFGGAAGPGASSPISDRLIHEVAGALRQMHEDGTLEDWVDIPLTAQRIGSEAMIASMQWVMGVLSTDGYHAALSYSTCMMLLGVARGPAVDAFRARIEASVDAARMSEPEQG
jgi:AcrR family transcriptional regulator